MKKKLLLVTAAAFMAFGAIGYTGSRFFELKNPQIVKAEGADYQECDFGVGKLLITTTYKNKTYYLGTEASTSACPVAHEFTDVSSIDASNLWTVTQSGSSYYIQNDNGDYLNGTTANNGTRVSSTKQTWTYTENNSLKNANNRYLGVYNAADWRNYNSDTATNYDGSARNLVFYTVATDDNDLEISVDTNVVMLGETVNLTASGSIDGLSWYVTDGFGSVVDNKFTATKYGAVTIAATNSAGETSNEITIKVYPSNIDPVSAAVALDVCELTGTSNSPYRYKVIGEVGEVTTPYSEQYGNFSFDLIDDEADIISCYRAAATHEIAEGAKIQIDGYLVNYKGDTPQFASGAVCKEFYTVMYENDGSQYGDDVEVLEGSYLAEPSEPTKTGYSFVGWETENGTLWDFGADQVSESMILTAVWNSEADVSLQNDLDLINSWMSLSYRYTDTRENHETEVSMGEITDENYSVANNTAKSLNDAFANDSGIDFSWNSGTSTAWWLKQDDFRLYKGASLTISSGAGTSVFSVTAYKDSGEEINGISVELKDGSAILTSSTTIKYIASFVIEYGAGGIEDVDFRLRMATDNMDEFASAYSPTSYGIEVATGSRTKAYQYNANTYVDESTNKQYIVIGLGDVFANPARLTETFTIRAYAVSGGKTFYSTKTKESSVVDLVKTYHEMDGISELVEPLYDYLTTLGYID